MTAPDKTPLGKKTRYPDHYDPGLLCPIARSDGRAQLALGAGAALPFYGEDLWNAYEVSWLDGTGKPEVAMMVLRVPADSPYLVESKSMKLYFNSFNMARFASPEAVASVVTEDLSKAAGIPVTVALVPPGRFIDSRISEPPGGCLDLLTPLMVGYHVDPSGLTCDEDSIASEAWFTRLFRSTCPVTGQPDWGTVSIVYSGGKIDPAGLLGYLISYRQHAGFHENCVERIFMDITRRCRPETLTVAARFTRRGGVDINPVRGSEAVVADNVRDPRQ